MSIQDAMIVSYLTRHRIGEALQFEFLPEDGSPAVSLKIVADPMATDGVGYVWMRGELVKIVDLSQWK